jgi:hypothetical protein
MSRHDWQLVRVRVLVCVWELGPYQLENWSTVGMRSGVGWGVGLGVGCSFGSVAGSGMGMGMGLGTGVGMGPGVAWGISSLKRVWVWVWVWVWAWAWVRKSGVASVGEPGCWCGFGSRV